MFQVGQRYVVLVKGDEMAEEFRFDDAEFMPLSRHGFPVGFRVGGIQFGDLPEGFLFFDAALQADA